MNDDSSNSGIIAAILISVAVLALITIAIFKTYRQYHKVEKPKNIQEIKQKDMEAFTYDQIIIDYMSLPEKERHSKTIRQGLENSKTTIFKSKLKHYTAFVF